MKTEFKILVAATCATALLFMAGCAQKGNRDAIEKVLRAKTESINKTGTVESIREMFSPDYVFHSPGNPDAKGLDAYIANLKTSDATFRPGFPDYRLNIVDMVIGDNKAMVHYNITATHKGAFAGVPATGKSVNMASIYLYRFENGKLVEGTEVVSDRIGLMQQIGAIPAPQSK